jgi:hypothetical protein
MVYDKQSYQDNKDKIKEYYKNYRKQYYEQNKDTILTKQKEKITCECGSTINKSYISEHRKTQKHINYINSKSQN